MAKKKIKVRVKKSVETQTFADYFGTKSLKSLRNRLEDLFKSKNGFVLIFTGEDAKITDAYKGICAHCVLDRVVRIVEDADSKGLLWGCNGKDQ